MPKIFESRDLSVKEEKGMRVKTLANATMLGTDALQVKQIMLEAGTKSETFAAVEAERFIYVIHGKGQAYVGEEVFPLETESVLWLEKQDAFMLEADETELELLLCQAPAME